MTTVPQHAVKTSPQPSKAILKLPSHGTRLACRSRHRRRHAQRPKRSGRPEDRCDGSVGVIPKCELPNAHLCRHWGDKGVAQ